MKIIDLAICTDNNDPQHLGRIRYVTYYGTSGDIEKSIDYDKWSDRDPFVATPLLPTNINFIPEIGQAVKILTFDTEKDMVNQQYIAGPFSTMHDFNSQTFSQSIENTSYGSTTKHKKKIVSEDGKFRDPRAEGAFAKHSDYGLYGKYGSDIIFTENGLQLRGGKLITKEGATPNDREKLLSVPLMSKKSSKIFLKKFPKKMTLKSVDIPKSKTESKTLNYIIEYTLDDVVSPNRVDFYVYKVKKPYGNDYSTNVFTEYTELNNEYLTLINLAGSGNTPTYSIDVSTIKEGYIETRGTILTMDSDGLKGLNSLYNDNDLHPFYFRPTKEFRERTGNVDEKIKYLNNINVRTIGPNSGLIWSYTSPNPPTKITSEKLNQPTIEQNSNEQTFSSVVSDKMYFLSTDTNNTDKSIKFDDLNKYEYSQNDYIERIEPNTYSLVRGENLLNLLYAIIDVLQSHRHNLNDPYARVDYPQHNRLVELFLKMENDLLNKSIRIN